MRPAGRGELESLYFQYPTFEFRRSPELKGDRALHPVAVAGAGPVGLAAALELARRGIACVVLERKNTVNDGSRAICVSRHSFETLQQLGVASRFEEKALGWTSGRCYYRDRMIYRLEMPHSPEERYLPMYNIQQQYIEQFLIDRASEFPELIDLRWQNEVTSVAAEGDEVVSEVQTPEGAYCLRSRYLLAADGAASLVRKSLGLKLHGENLPGRYVIADVRMQHDFPTERRSFFESAANPDSTILIHRQPDDIWRIDWQLRGHEDPVEAVREANVRRRLQAILDMIGHEGAWDLEWWSIYTANTLCLDDYRHGRILFVGDSAHIVPIFGVRGLNNGFDDAVNAGWKLAYVLQGRAGDALLDSYTPERRGATLDVFRNAGKSSRFMTPPSRGYALLRKAALQLSLSQEFTRRLADPRQVAPYTYADSPLTSFPERDREFVGGVPAGAVAVNRRTGADDFLLGHAGPGFTGLCFSKGESLPGGLPDLARRLQSIDPDFRLIQVSRTPARHEGIDVIVDEGNISEGYAARDGTFYLLRPDRHVAARWLVAESAEIESALRAALAGGTG
ncbi:MAG TPA: FAD-dependent monooxygenase [Woeseiaceae bacterium]|nr:FAD-dependent monooxygenase [Woeseiaceae bacterium]